MKASKALLSVTAADEECSIPGQVYKECDSACPPTCNKKQPSAKFIPVPITQKRSTI